MLYLFFFKPLRDHLRGFLIAAWAGDKIAEFSFPEISFHFPLRPWFFFVSPAYAGKSVMESRGYGFDEDHPRVCGEKHALACRSHLHQGSPPRMRGKVPGWWVCKVLFGITPAYAGKRMIAGCSIRGRWDHPRVCGEKPLSLSLPSSTRGSPPRMRGKADYQPDDQTHTGITPAYAGKSQRRAQLGLSCQDHPRVCGEKLPALFVTM